MCWFEKANFAYLSLYRRRWKASEIFSLISCSPSLSSTTRSCAMRTPLWGDGTNMGLCTYMRGAHTFHLDEREFLQNIGVSPRVSVFVCTNFFFFFFLYPSKTFHRGQCSESSKIENRFSKISMSRLSCGSISQKECHETKWITIRTLFEM